MPAHTVKLQKERDFKEKDLNSLEFALKSSDQTLVMYKKDFEEQLKRYQIWKKEHKIEGILY